MMRNPFAPHINFLEFQGLIESNPKFLPSNLDMIMERNGKFLVAEWKRELEVMPWGQELLLRKMVSPDYTVLIVIGDNGTNVSGFSKLKEDGKRVELGKTMDELKDYIKGWYKWASASQS